MDTMPGRAEEEEGRRESLPSNSSRLSGHCRLLRILSSCIKQILPLLPFSSLPVSVCWWASSAAAASEVEEEAPSGDMYIIGEREKERSPGEFSFLGLFPSPPTTLSSPLPKWSEAGGTGFANFEECTCRHKKNFWIENTSLLCTFQCAFLTYCGIPHQ